MNVWGLSWLTSWGSSWRTNTAPPIDKKVIVHGRMRQTVSVTGFYMPMIEQPGRLRNICTVEGKLR